MENEQYLKLRSIISQFPYLLSFLDDNFIRGQCKRGMHNYFLKLLVDTMFGERLEKHLSSLEKRLCNLSSVHGYERLGNVLRGAYNWDRYQDALAQIDITLWYKEKGLVKEIEPEIPECHRNGSSDILLSFQRQEIYCEVKSFQSIAESMKVASRNSETNRAVKILLRKANRQLPLNHPSILALDTTKSGIFSHDVKDIAERLFPYTPHVALVILWSWEGDGEPSWDMIPSSFFINSKSRFREVGEALLQHLGSKRNVTVI